VETDPYYKLPAIY